MISINPNTKKEDEFESSPNLKGTGKELKIHFILPALADTGKNGVIGKIGFETNAFEKVENIMIKMSAETFLN